MSERRKVVGPVSRRVAQRSSLVRALATMFVAWSIVICAGCGGTTELPTEFGSRRVGVEGASVAGVGALAKLFQLEGHSVGDATRLSKRLTDAQTLVWAPDSYQGPAAEARDYLEDWLAAEPGRTVVYIGRDYDPAEQYWEAMAASAKAPESFEYARRWAETRSMNDRRRASAAKTVSYGWFDLRRNDAPRRVDSLDGPWAVGVDPAQADVRLYAKLEPDPEVVNAPAARPGPPSLSAETLWPNDDSRVETLLQSENDLLAFRRIWRSQPTSQLIVVANGSFLLNLPLANPENRKLAMRLVRACGSPGRVVFVESDANGIRVVKDDDDRPPNVWSSLMHWPLGPIWLHTLAAGLAFCTARFLHFGRPKRLYSDAVSDFGRHVEALGTLLAKSRDRGYAEHKVQQYRQHARRASGARHDEPATSAAPQPIVPDVAKTPPGGPAPSL